MARPLLFVLDAGLDNFFLPLVNLALGYIVLHERPRPAMAS